VFVNETAIKRESSVIMMTEFNNACGPSRLRTQRQHGIKHPGRRTWGGGGRTNTVFRRAAAGQTTVAICYNAPLAAR